MPTFTDGTVVHATDLRPLVGSQPPTYRAHQQSAAQTFTNNTTTDVTFDTSDTDSDSGRTSSTVYTCKTAGMWAITPWINWAASTAGERDLSLLVNGGVVKAIANPASSVSAAWTQTFTYFVALAVNDTVKVQALQNSGGNLANNGNTGGYAGLHMVRISN